MPAAPAESPPPDGPAAAALARFARAVKLAVAPVTTFAALSGLLLFLYGMAARAFAPQFTGAWIEVVTVYLIMWSVMLAAIGVSVEGEHVRADFLIRMLPRAASRVLDTAGMAAATAYCALMAWSSWLVLDFSILVSERGPSELRIPLALYYAAYPLSFGLSTVGCAVAATLVILRSRKA